MKGKTVFKLFITFLIATLILTSCSNQSSVQVNSIKTEKTEDSKGAIDIDSQIDNTLKVDPGKRMFTNKQWVQDINHLQLKLSSLHPNMFFKITREEYKKKIDELKLDLKNLTDTQIKFRIKQIVASIGDGHTGAYFYVEPYKKLPLELRWFGEDLRVISAIGKYEKINGMKLKAIDNKNIKEVINQVNTLISSETEAHLRNENPELVVDMDTLIYFGFAKGDTVTLTLENDRGKIQKIKAQALPYKTLSKMTWYTYAKRMVNIPLLPQGEYKPYWYKYMEKEKIFYFKYTECIDKNTAKDIGRNPANYPDFNEFVKGLVEEFKKHETDKFVLDLRGNTGGYSNLLDYSFKQYIKYTPQWINLTEKKGRLFVLVDRGTFSAGVINAIDFKQLGEAIIVGEPTGGMKDFFGGPEGFTLKNSALKIYCATAKVSFYYNDRTSLQPDVVIEQSYKNYEKGIDEVMEYVKNYK